MNTSGSKETGEGEAMKPSTMNTKSFANAPPLDMMIQESKRKNNRPRRGRLGRLEPAESMNRELFSRDRPRRLHPEDSDFDRWTPSHQDRPVHPPFKDREPFFSSFQRQSDQIAGEVLIEGDFNRYEGRGDGEVTMLGAGESYRPSNRPRSPLRSDTFRSDRDRDRSPIRRERARTPPRDRARTPLRDRARTPPRDRARTPALGGDSYHPGSRARTPPRRRSRSRSPGLFRPRDRTPPRDVREIPNWRNRERARTPPRRFSPRRDDRRDRPRSPRRDDRDIRRRSRSPFDRDRVLPRGRSPLPGRRSPPTGPRGAWRPRSRTPERRNDRGAAGPTSASWRRRSPSPVRRVSGRESGQTSGNTSRRSSPHIHPSRAALHATPEFDDVRPNYMERPRARSPPPRERSPFRSATQSHRESGRSTPISRSPLPVRANPPPKERPHSPRLQSPRVNSPRPRSPRPRSPAPSRAQSPPPLRARSPPPSRARSPPPSRARSPPPSRARSPPPSRARSPPPSRARSPPPSRARSPLPSRARSPPPLRARSPLSRARSPPPSRARSPPGSRPRSPPLSRARSPPPPRARSPPLSRPRSPPSRARSPPRSPRARSPPRGPAGFRAPPTGPSGGRNFTAPVAPSTSAASSTMPSYNRQESSSGSAAPPAGPRGYQPSARGGFQPRGGRSSFSERGALRPEPTWGGVPSRPAPSASPTPPTAPAASPVIPTGPRASISHASSNEWSNKPWPTAPTRSAATPTAPSNNFTIRPQRPYEAAKPVQRIHPALANIPPIIVGGKIDPATSGIPTDVAARLKKAREEEEKIREDLKNKEETLRRGLRMWDKLERESAAAGLKSEASERQVRLMAGEGMGGAAY